MLEKRLREHYDGEFVVINTVFRNGKKEQEREWIDNPIEIKSLNNRACCIAPGSTAINFPLKRLENHRGGLLSRNKMQLYGSEEIWEHMTPTFLVVTDTKKLPALIKNGYPSDHIVYTTSSNCISNPGEFYLIPYGVSMVSAATTMWISCFDGHKDIYLLGYDELNKDHDRQEKLILSVTLIMQTYSDVKFHHVSNIQSPDEWRNCINFDRITRDTFISECDI